MSTIPVTVDPRYPIGKFSRPTAFDAEQHATSIATLAALPANLRSAVAGLSDAQLDTPYREGGWTVRQLVHHVADSHMNAYIRFRLALTEDWPVIKLYNEKLWAELADSLTGPVDVSLALVESLHHRWVLLAESLADTDWQRGYEHPVNGRQPLELAVALYDWHGRHHVAHIVELRKSRGWL